MAGVKREREAGSGKWGAGSGWGEWCAVPSPATSRGLSLVQRAAHAQRSFLQHVRINHRRFYVLVPQQFLDSANIVARFQQVRGEGVAESMGRNRFDNAAGPGCGAHGTLQRGVISMVAVLFTTARIYA